MKPIHRSSISYAANKPSPLRTSVTFEPATLETSDRDDLNVDINFDTKQHFLPSEPKTVLPERKLKPSMTVPKVHSNKVPYLSGPFGTGDNLDHARSSEHPSKFSERCGIPKTSSKEIVKLEHKKLELSEHLFLSNLPIDVSKEIQPINHQSSYMIPIDNTTQVASEPPVKSTTTRQPEQLPVHGVPAMSNRLNRTSTSTDKPRSNSSMASRSVKNAIKAPFIVKPEPPKKSSIPSKSSTATDEKAIPRPRHSTPGEPTPRTYKFLTIRKSKTKSQSNGTSGPNGVVNSGEAEGTISHHKTATSTQPRTYKFLSPRKSKADISSTSKTFEDSMIPGGFNTETSTDKQPMLTPQVDYNKTIPKPQNSSKRSGIPRSNSFLSSHNAVSTLKSPSAISTVSKPSTASTNPPRKSPNANTPRKPSTSKRPLPPIPATSPWKPPRSPSFLTKSPSTVAAKAIPVPIPSSSTIPSPAKASKNVKSIPLSPFTHYDSHLKGTAQTTQTTQTSQTPQTTQTSQTPQGSPATQAIVSAWLTAYQERKKTMSRINLAISNARSNCVGDLTPGNSSWVVDGSSPGKGKGDETYLPGGMEPGRDGDEEGDEVPEIDTSNVVMWEEDKLHRKKQNHNYKVVTTAASKRDIPPPNFTTTSNPQADEIIDSSPIRGSSYPKPQHSIPFTTTSSQTFSTRKTGRKYNPSRAPSSTGSGSTTTTEAATNHNYDSSISELSCIAVCSENRISTISPSPSPSGTCDPSEPGGPEDLQYPEDLESQDNPESQEHPEDPEDTNSEFSFENYYQQEVSLSSPSPPLSPSSPSPSSSTFTTWYATEVHSNPLTQTTLPADLKARCRDLLERARVLEEYYDGLAAGVGGAGLTVGGGDGKGGKVDKGKGKGEGEMERKRQRQKDLVERLHHRGECRRSCGCLKRS